MFQKELSRATFPLDIVLYTSSKYVIAYLCNVENVKKYVRSMWGVTFRLHAWDSSTMILFIASLCWNSITAILHYSSSSSIKVDS